MTAVGPEPPTDEEITFDKGVVEGQRMAQIEASRRGGPTLREAALRLHNVIGKHRNVRVQDARLAVRSALSREEVVEHLARAPARVEASQDATGHRVDITTRLGDMLVKARRLVECPTLVEWANNDPAAGFEVAGLMKALRDALDGKLAVAKPIPFGSDEGGGS